MYKICHHYRGRSDKKHRSLLFLNIQTVLKEWQNIHHIVTPSIQYVCHTFIMSFLWYTSNLSELEFITHFTNLKLSHISLTWSYHTSLTWSYHTVNITSLVYVIKKVWSRSLQFLIKTWHHSHMVHGIWSAA